MEKLDPQQVSTPYMLVSQIAHVAALPDQSLSMFWYAGYLWWKLLWCRLAVLPLLSLWTQCDTSVHHAQRDQENQWIAGAPPATVYIGHFEACVQGLLVYMPCMPCLGCS